MSLQALALEMYKALYDQKTSSPNCLSFEAGDKFTALQQPQGTAQADWVFVENGFGEIGYVPRSYVTRDDNVCIILYSHVKLKDVASKLRPMHWY